MMTSNDFQDRVSLLLMYCHNGRLTRGLLVGKQMLIMKTSYYPCCSLGCTEGNYFLLSVYSALPQLIDLYLPTRKFETGLGQLVFSVSQGLVAIFQFHYFRNMSFVFKD